ncbi:MAG: hypothetical protein NTV62_03860 [Candidatus Gribaldobacteria bacterium]|nr:hypothetical protein [Candidatus Gribaldobacteria bacterium]
MSGEIVMDLIIKIIFWASLAGFVFIVLSKTSQVKALVVDESQHNLGLDFAVWTQRAKKVGEDFGKIAPQMAKGIVAKNKQLVVKKIEALKFFSSQRVVYKYKKKKLTDQNSQLPDTKAVDEKCEFNCDYWDNIKKQ